jgi:hypothetical protein
MSTPTATADGWTGWYRRTPRALWRLWCRASTEGECERQLLDSAPAGDKLVLRSGRDPNQDERARLRR